MSRLDSCRNATGKDLVAHNASIDLHALGIAHSCGDVYSAVFNPSPRRIASKNAWSKSCHSFRQPECNRNTRPDAQLIEHMDNRLKQRPSIPRNPPRISSKPHSLTKRKQLKRERHKIRPRTLRHKPKSPQHKKSPNRQRAPPIQNISQTPLCSDLKATTKWPHQAAVPSRNRHGSG